MTRNELKEIFRLVWNHEFDPDEAMEHFDEETQSPVCENCGDVLDGKIILSDKE